MKNKNYNKKRADFFKLIKFNKFFNISFFYNKNKLLFKLFIFLLDLKKSFNFSKKKKEFLNEKYKFINKKHKKQIFLFFMFFIKINYFYKKHKSYKKFIILPLLIKLLKCGLL